MFDEIQEGELIRHMIENNNKAKLTTRKELRTILNVDKKDFNSALDLLNKSLEEIGLALSSTSSIYDAETFFLVRSQSENSKKIKLSLCPKKFYSLAVIITFIYLENSSVELNKFMNTIGKIFGDKDCNEIFCELKRMKYLKIEKYNEEMMVGYGWRYYIEFVDFNPLDFFSK